ncbi:hypothetical protein GCM10010329_34590 [Streptomyces spiroverticillatus]|uniref:Integral membrane protein n=1 Tax=Streptomyces finlayi TaxID=67296 RepID=A0A918WWY5_9ACTN|nr:hypothetical protein [Streptomyces finlayi]GHA08858.1 hypothetical protein GCM10010329_34590 [Streptomyces spiroverticillatus]GHC91707.1 hypothetical protein GCM10010334_27000 [Streptomyces finlayi]
MNTAQFDGITAPATTTGTDGLARLALKLDAAVTGLNGLAYLGLATVLESWFGIATAVQYPVGAFLLLYALGVLAAGTRRRISRTALTAIVAANLLWVALSLTLAVAGTLTPTGAGTFWLVLQALTVGGFAGLQLLGLKRM